MFKSSFCIKTNVLVLNLAFEFNTFESISEMRYFLILNNISSISLLFFFSFLFFTVYTTGHWAASLKQLKHEGNSSNFEKKSNVLIFCSRER